MHAVVMNIGKYTSLHLKHSSTSNNFRVIRNFDLSLVYAGIDNVNCETWLILHEVCNFIYTNNFKVVVRF